MSYVMGVMKGVMCDFKIEDVNVKDLDCINNKFLVIR